MDDWVATEKQGCFYEASEDLIYRAQLYRNTKTGAEEWRVSPYQPTANHQAFIDQHTTWGKPGLC